MTKPGTDYGTFAVAVAALYRPAMVFRPDPIVVKAKLAEIASRYASKRKRATKPQFAAIRVAELNRLFRARYGEVLPQDERGREAMWVVAQHLIQLSGVPLDRLMKWSSLAAPWLTVGEAVAVISEVAGHPMKWKADSLAWRLKLTYADRQVLRITTIGAIDFNATKRRNKRRKASQRRSRLWRKLKRLSANAP